MYAVINAQGRQRRVEPGEIVWLEKNKAQEGDTITFNDVLLLNDGKQTLVGAPCIAGASVQAMVLRQLRDRKVLIFKYKRRKGMARKRGYRHSYTEARITDIRKDDVSLVPADMAIAPKAKAAETEPAAQIEPAPTVA
ncbi:MAG: 50S ribosomal protein L21 [Candidatus Sumerlaeota bacterium]|nr:50S ribosomal protein L21 [Candidatus Sumerlaeota bacterium]